MCFFLPPYDVVRIICLQHAAYSFLFLQYPALYKVKKQKFIATKGKINLHDCCGCQSYRIEKYRSHQQQHNSKSVGV